jgi:tetratricopeptide (TPR) repeat protein
MLVAALFAWHPLHVESVAWVSERKDTLSTFFALLTLLSYVKYVQSKRQLHLWLASLWLALGLMAKPMLVTLPCLMLLLDFWPLRRFPQLTVSSFRPLVVEKLPFFALISVSCILTFMAQQAGDAVISLQTLPLSSRIENAVLACALYTLKLFWPVNLAVLYPLELKPLADCVWPVIALVVITGVAYRMRHRQPCWLVGWLWFLGSLVPVIGLVQVGGSFMADRYTYFPAVGVFMAIAFGVPEFYWSKRSVQAAALLVLLACAVLTKIQLSYWRDGETLFRHTLAITRNNPVARINLGLELEQQNRIEEALDEYRKVTKIDPNNFRIHFYIGNMLLKLERPAEALAEYRQCLARTPAVPSLHNAAANALAAQGELTDALQEFAEAEQLDPHYSQPHLDLARIYLARGQDTKAREELEAAVQSTPSDVKTLTMVARYLAANANAAARDGTNALAIALQANKLAGERQPEVFDVLGMAFASLGDFTNAIICAQNALEFAPITGMKDTAPLQQRLELYQKRQPWVESFQATNAAAKY